MSDGYAALARYTDSSMLVNVDLENAPEALRQGLDREAGNRRVLGHRFETLRGRDLRYNSAWSVPRPDESQYFLDPSTLLRSRGGQCLDLTLTLSSMCLQAGLSPLIAVSDWHALLIVRLADQSPLGELVVDAPPGTKTSDERHVHEIDHLDSFLGAIDAGHFAALECENATTDRDSTFDEALLGGRGWLRPGHRLVDVRALHAEGLRPYGRPDGEPPIRSYLPDIAPPSHLWGNQRRALRELEGATGKAAIFSDSGLGKSTVAYEVLRRTPGRAAWFLDASSRSALEASLADAELSYIGGSVADLSKMSRSEHAETALMRLRSSPEPWTVVLDNANAGPGDLGSAIPVPKLEREQLVLVTTTSDAWGPEVGSSNFIELGRVPSREVQKNLAEAGVTTAGVKRLSKTIAGSAVVLDAYSRYITNEGFDERLAEDPAKDQNQEVAALRLLYQVATRGRSRRVRDARTAATIASLLPPERVPAQLLVATSDGANVAHELARAGLLTEGTSSIHRMHRLVGAAVREEENDRLTHAARELARSDQACRVMDRWAGPETMENFAAELKRGAPEDKIDRAVGREVHRVGAVLEMKGNVERSAELFAIAERNLDGARTLDDRQRQAECMLGQARWGYQMKAATKRQRRTQLSAAMKLATDAENIVSQLHGPDAAGRYVAMRGLIEKELGKIAPPDDQVELLDKSLQTLMDADVRRQRSWQAGVGHVDEVELVRSRYNLAGIRIDLAKRKPKEARRLLDDARKIYGEVASERRRLYGLEGSGGAHPHVASCIHGHAIVAFYEALLVCRNEAERTDRLRHALAKALEGLDDRVAIAGDRESNDIHKSTGLIAKICLARDALPSVSLEELDERLSEAREEFLASGLSRLERNSG